jgi:hypothetical protein
MSATASGAEEAIGHCHRPWPTVLGAHRTNGPLTVVPHRPSTLGTTAKKLGEAAGNVGRVRVNLIDAGLSGGKGGTPCPLPFVNLKLYAVTRNTTLPHFSSSWFLARRRRRRIRRKRREHKGWDIRTFPDILWVPLVHSLPASHLSTFPLFTPRSTHSSELILAHSNVGNGTTTPCRLTGGKSKGKSSGVGSEEEAT